MIKVIKLFFDPISSRLSIKLAILLLCFTLIPLTVISFVFLVRVEKNFTKEIIENRREIVKGYAQDISSIMSNPYKILESYASLVGTLFGDKERQHIALVKLSIDVPLFEEIVLIDLSGTPVTSSSPAQVDISQKYNKKEIFLSALSGEGALSRLYIDDNFIPAFNIAIPCFHLNRMQGILFAKVNLSKLWDVVDSIHVGKTGKAFVSTREGLLISHWDKKKVIKGEMINAKPYYDNLIHNINGVLEYFDEESKSLKIIYYALIEDFGFSMGIVQEAKEVYYFKRITYIFLIVAIVLIVLVSILLSFWVARRVTLPLERMTDASRKIERRDYDINLIPKTKDEIGKLCISFNHMAKKLKEADENQRFVMFGYAAANIAHKLKNAIVSIKTITQLFHKSRKEPKLHEELEGDLTNEVKRLELMISRFSSFKQKLQEQLIGIDVVSLLSDIVETKRSFFIEHNVTCQTLYKVNSAFIKGDKEELNEVFNNIINNSVEAMPQGGELNISVNLSTVTDTDYFDNQDVMISFTDQGSGIEKKELEKIFTPFYSTKQFGMGIGLTFCKRVVAQYNGHINIESELKKGTTIKIAFPHIKLPNNKSYQ